MAAADPDIVAITAAMPGGTSWTPLQRNSLIECLNVGIAEQHATTMAAGMATQG
ncbi:hypothetical protein [Sinobaca sp. H24]|uniref:hypothetical protein n=1 Tax=Sinobaca sp. H24 TaxID=2923376 RepID=UPI00207A555B|nr:hypothetical protein [Sinobaca sp. H24]